MDVRHIHPKFVVPKSAANNYATFALFVANAIDGELQIFTEAGGNIIAGLTAGTKFFIAQKQGRNVLTTALYTYETPAKEIPYSAPVSQSIEFTVTSGATAVGQTFSLGFVNLVFGYEPFQRERYEFVSQTGSETAVLVATGIYQDWLKFKQRIDNYGSEGRGYQVILTNPSPGVLVATPVVPEYYFEPVIGDDLVASVNYTANYAPGAGTPYQVKQFELESDVFYGLRVPMADKRDNWGKEYRYTNPSGFYDLITFTCSDYDRDAASTVNKLQFTKNLDIYFEKIDISTPNANIAQIKTALNV